MLESRDTRRQKRQRARRYEREDARYHESRSGSKSYPLIAAGAVVIVIAVVLLCNGLFKEFGSSRERADLEEYYGVSSPDDIVLLVNGETSEESVKMDSGVPFIPMSMAQELYDNFYYDSLEGHLLVTGATHTVEGTPGNDYIAGDEVYVSLDFLSRFAPLTYELYTAPSRIDLITKALPVTITEMTEDAKMRVSANRQSPILMDLNKGDEIQIVAGEEDWAEIRYKAVTGYVETKYLSEDRQSREASLSGGNEKDDAYEKLTRPYKIVLGFHNVAVADANAYLKDATAQTKGMNVIAPTWMSIAHEDGSLESIGSASYVEEAHDMGLEVWGVVDNFTRQIDTNEVLSHTGSRLALEQNIINAALEYGLDGINIDFEQLAGETGDDFAQFLRELSIYTRANDLVLSIDNYVPQDYTDFYRRDIQGRVADYVIIMGYDEHTSASTEAGSVASLGFVTQGIEDTLKEVAAAQVINAIPFYTRKWADEGGILSCESLGMRDARAFVADNGTRPVWDAEACQNYASFEKDGVLYSIWLEDAESISSKLTVMKAHDLGGVACWKLTQETPDIWDTITAYYPGTP